MLPYGIYSNNSFSCYDKIYLTDLGDKQLILAHSFREHGPLDQGRPGRVALVVGKCDGVPPMESGTGNRELDWKWVQSSNAHL